jgi:hypothetical protein
MDNIFKRVWCEIMVREKKVREVCVVTNYTCKLINSIMEEQKKLVDFLICSIVNSRAFWNDSTLSPFHALGAVLDTKINKRNEQKTILTLI